MTHVVSGRAERPPPRDPVPDPDRRCPRFPPSSAERAASAPTSPRSRRRTRTGVILHPDPGSTCLARHQPADALRQAPRPARRRAEAGRGGDAKAAVAAPAGGAGSRGEGLDAGVRGVPLLRGRGRGRTPSHLLEPGRRGAALHSFTFPRQATATASASPTTCCRRGTAVRDSVALFVVTAGAGVRERAEAAKAAGEYLRSHALQALALETAEAAAEWLHAPAARAVGLPGPARSSP